MLAEPSVLLLEIHLRPLSNKVFCPKYTIKIQGNRRHMVKQRITIIVIISVLLLF